MSLMSGSDVTVNKRTSYQNLLKYFKNLVETYLHLVEKDHLGLGDTGEAGEEGNILLQVLQSLLLIRGETISTWRGIYCFRCFRACS